MNSTGTNSGSWRLCQMRLDGLPDILARMPVAVQDGIRAVSKRSAGSLDKSTIEVTSDQLFLLSEVELFGTCSNSVVGEGVQYAYYAAGNSKIKKHGGSAIKWMTRSPHDDHDSYFCAVDNTGLASYMSPNELCYASPAFCF